MSGNQENWSKNAEIKIFQDYLKIRTDHPDVNYGKSELISIEKSSLSTQIKSKNCL